MRVVADLSSFAVDDLDLRVYTLQSTSSRETKKRSCVVNRVWFATFYVNTKPMYASSLGCCGVPVGEIS